jgi:hypothetical protein
MDRNSITYFDHWPGVEHIQYSGDYHVDGKKHLTLEEVAKLVAEQQSKGKQQMS